MGQLNVHRKHIAARDCARVSLRFAGAGPVIARQKETERDCFSPGKHIRNQLTGTTIPLSVVSLRYQRVQRCDPYVFVFVHAYPCMHTVFMKVHRISQLYRYMQPAVWHSVNSWETGADAPKQLSVRSRTSNSAVPLVHPRKCRRVAKSCTNADCSTLHTPHCRIFTANVRETRCARCSAFPH